MADRVDLYNSTYIRTAESLLSFAEEAVPRLRGLEAKAVFGQLDHR